MSELKKQLGLIFAPPGAKPLTDALSDKAKRSFSSMSPEIQVKTLLNVRSVSTNLLLDCFISCYPHCSRDLVDIQGLRLFALRSRLWIEEDQNLTTDQQELEERLVRDSLQQEKVYLKWLSYNIFGCPLSRDIDLALVVDFIKGEPDLTRLREELTTLGYSPEKELDITLIRIDHKGNVTESSKGCKHETQNMILQTYKYHQQQYPCITNQMIVVNDIETRVRTIAKFTLDNLKLLVDPQIYAEQRIAKIKAYEGYWNRVDYVLKMLPLLNFSEESPDPVKSCIKSLSVKIMQLSLALRGEREYTKLGLVNLFYTNSSNSSSSNPSNTQPGLREGLQYLVTRGEQGRWREGLFRELLRLYRDIATASSKEIQTVTMNRYTLDLTNNPTLLPDHIYNEFLRSPLEPTQVIKQYFEKKCADRQLNSIFPIFCRNIELIPTHIQSKVIAVDQRTPEWLRLLQYYTCGNNTGVTPYSGDDWVSFYYHLIRGCITELVVINNFDFAQLFPEEKEVEKITLGLLVENKVKQSRGIAPDLILKVRDKLIPVEIKCLTGPPNDNHDFRRAVNLAERELLTSKDLLQSEQGIIITVFVNTEGFQIFHVVR